jgi:hypothetical protein
VIYVTYTLHIRYIHVQNVHPNLSCTRHTQWAQYRNASVQSGRSNFLFLRWLSSPYGRARFAASTCMSFSSFFFMAVVAKWDGGVSLNLLYVCYTHTHTHTHTTHTHTHTHTQVCRASTLAHSCRRSHLTDVRDDDDSHCTAGVLIRDLIVSKEAY